MYTIKYCLNRKKRALHLVNIIKVGGPSLSPAYHQCPLGFSSPKVFFFLSLFRLVCFIVSLLSAAVKACQCTVCRGWRWHYWKGHIYRGRRTEPLRWGMGGIRAAARTRSRWAPRWQWWPVSRQPRWPGPGWGTPPASSSLPEPAPAWGYSFWRAAKWQFWRVSSPTGCARKGWPLAARPARRSDRASVVSPWRWCLASVVSALWFSYLLLPSPGPQSAGPCHTCRRCRRRDSARPRCSPPPRSCLRSRQNWRTKIRSADPVTPLYLLPVLPAESGPARSGQSSWWAIGGLGLVAQCRPMTGKGPSFWWTRRWEFCEKCPPCRRSSSSSCPYLGAFPRCCCCFRQQSLMESLYVSRRVSARARSFLPVLVLVVCWSCSLVSWDADTRRRLVY